jgi:hypothetical protein
MGLLLEEIFCCKAAGAEYFNAYLRDTKLFQIREETPILEEDVLRCTAPYKIGVSTK